MESKPVPDVASNPVPVVASNPLTTWSQQRELSDRATLNPPALASKDGVLCMVWQGTNQGTVAVSAALFEMYASTSNDLGTTWTPQKGLTNLNVDKADGDFVTGSAPALTVVDGKFVLAWSGLDHVIYVSSSTDGLNWSAQQALGKIGGNDPWHTSVLSLASTGDLAVMGWTFDTFMVSTSKDGSHWTAPTKLGDRNGSGPAIAGTAGKLVMAWKGLAQGNIWVSTSTNGIDWSPQLELNDRATSSTPALIFAVGLGVWYMAWEGLVPPFGSAGNIYVAYSSDGLKWSAQMELGDRATPTGPALGSVFPLQFMAWQGVTENNIWTSVLQG
jgi:hypothetical protein